MLRRSALLLATTATLVACSRPPTPSPTDTTSPTAAPSVTAQSSAPPSASASAPPVETTAAAAAPRALPASEDEDLYCRKGEPLRADEWKATPAEVRAAVEKARFVCAPTSWLPEAVSLCMQRLGQINVVVRYGVMDGDRATQQACDIAVQTASFNGRKWVTLVNDIRDGPAFFGYVTAMELTPQGPITSTNGCQRDAAGKVAGSIPPREPRGWKTFPEDLKSRLCK